MNRTVKTFALGLMAVAVAGVVALVSPQLMASQGPSTDTNVPAGSTVAATSQAPSDLVDSYNWRTTASFSRNPRF